ncbi:NAD(P)/FAD-dependent oxidoreductase [Luteibacter sp. UNCMF366Tsu5.1]|uniref:NAD(P)/FAD-dependent oxidoreductase n=1 Tax=Luteibacter sp. UNCMF366Tsu5.1 TaxID=1502758 RepID=UPI000908DF31|nr:FAD-dependent oxidoreductase [Luteibacter sp. UNCMF366Tsu5.1]SFW56521.1 Glycine/D-amino acid oxidase [Luteibacter sp. UNCMF366Tsu5.1]
MKESATDVIVIGAGMAGASLAWFLAPHLRVTMLEREPFPGFHTTGRSAAHFSESYGSAQVRALSRATRPFLASPPEGFAAHPLLQPRGSLVIGGAEQAERVHAEYEAVRAFTPSLRWLRDQDIAALVPVLRPTSAHVAFFEPHSADIDVNELHQGFLRGAKAHGALLHVDTDVASLQRDGSDWVVNERWRAPVVVNAAGAWADEIARLGGVLPIGLEPRRRSAFTFAAPTGIDASGWPFVVDIDETFYFKPDAGLMLGSAANADPTHPHDVQPEAFDIALGIHRIEEATTMTIARPVRTWAGLRSFVADGDLVGGFAPDADGFFWLAAQGGYGIQTSAAMAEACAAMIMGRALPAHLVDEGITEAMLGPARLRV